MQVEVAAGETARRQHTLAFEHDVGRVHDEENFAPTVDVAQDLGKVLALHDRSLIGQQVAHDLQRADAVLARNLLEHAVRIEGKSRGKRLAFALNNRVGGHPLPP